MKTVLLAGLDSPEGIAVSGSTSYIYEGDTGEIKRHDTSGTEVIATLNSVVPLPPLRSRRPWYLMDSPFMREPCSQLTNENVLFIESLCDRLVTKRPTLLSILLFIL